MGKLLIVIVNWNTGTLLARCLASLQRLPEKLVISEVVIVDNDSTDNSIELTRQTIDNSIPVKLVKLTRNAGFARANNIGVKRSNRVHQHILLLNPDTEVQTGALDALLAVLEQDARAGIVGARLFHPDFSTQASVRKFPTLGTLIFLLLKLHRLFPNGGQWRRYMQINFNYDQEQSVDQVMGAAFLIRDETWTQIGPLDDHYWIWFEEVDYCRRAAEQGWRVVYAPSAHIIHHGSVSFSQLVGLSRHVPFLRSALYYTRKHLGWNAYFILLLFYPVSVLLALPAAIFHVNLKRENEKRITT